MTTDVRPQLDRARELIKAKRYSEARQVLVHVNHPTAEKWLEKLDEIEMFGAPIMASPSASTDTKPKRQTQRTDMLLQQAVAIFVNYDWEIKMQMPGFVQVEKKRAPSTTLSFFAIAIFGLLGMAVVMLDIANSKVEKVSLQLTDEGRIRITGSAGVMVTADHTQLYNVAQSVKKGATYAGAIALGIVSSIFWYVCLSVLFIPRYH